MDLTYPPEAEAFRVEIRQWLEENLPDGWFDEGFELDGEAKIQFQKEWTTTLFEGGWICATWPTEYGGKGLSTIQGVVLAEEFARAKAPMRADFFGDTLVGPTILMNGTEEQKKYFLPKILNGTMRWCQGFSEPNSGSDLASLKTTAVLDGDEWVVNGQKVWTSGARAADYGMLIARTDWDQPKHRGITFFFFPMKQAGVEVRPIRQATGDSRFNEVFITDARVPDANRLGELNAGWWVLQTALMYERAVMGVTQRRDSAKERAKINRDPTSEWSAPVPDLELVELARARGRTADPIVRQDLARLHCMRMVNEWNGRRAKALMEQGSSTPLASLGKLAMSGILHFAGRLQVGLLGPEGTLWGERWPDSADASYALHNAFFTSIGGGTDQIQRNIIGERILGLPKEPEVDKHVPFREVKKSPGRTITR